MKNPLLPLALPALALVAACGGSTATTPHAGPSPSASPALETAATAVRQMTQLALGTLHSTLLLQRIVRPGVAPLLSVPAGATATPACDAASATAYQTAPTVTNAGTRVVAAFYPGGDTTCSQSPLGLLVYVVPPAPGLPQLVTGYFVEYAQAGSDASQGTPVNIEPFNAEVDSLAAGTVNVELQSAPANVNQTSLAIPSAPAPGAFPSTFPVGLPDPTTTFGFSNDIIVAEGATGSQVAYIDYGGAIPNVNNASLTLGIIAIDNLLVTSNTLGGGARSISSLSRAPLASTDLVQPVPAYAPSPFPAPPGFATFSIPAADVSSKAVVTSVPNYGTKMAESGVFSENGWPNSLEVTYTDSATKVSVSLSTGNGGTTYDLFATDLVDGTPLLKVSPLPIDAGGSSAATTFNLDGSPFRTGQFKVTD